MKPRKQKPFWEEGSVRRIKPLRDIANPSIAMNVKTIEELPELYSIQEVARNFRVTTWTIYKWKCEGLIEATIDSPARFTAQQIADCRVRLKNRHQLKRDVHVTE